MRARLHDLSVARDGGWLLTIRTNENVGGLFDELHECDVDVTVKKYRKKRSLDANRLLWKMITEIADVLGAKKKPFTEITSGTMAHIKILLLQKTKRIRFKRPGLLWAKAGKQIKWILQRTDAVLSLELITDHRFTTPRG